MMEIDCQSILIEHCRKDVIGASDPALQYASGKQVQSKPLNLGDSFKFIDPLFTSNPLPASPLLL